MTSEVSGQRYKALLQYVNHASNGKQRPQILHLNQPSCNLPGLWYNCNWEQHHWRGIWSEKCSMWLTESCACYFWPLQDMKLLFRCKLCVCFKWSLLINLTEPLSTPCSDQTLIKLQNGVCLKVDCTPKIIPSRKRILHPETELQKMWLILYTGWW